MTSISSCFIQNRLYMSLNGIKKCFQKRKKQAEKLILNNGKRLKFKTFPLSLPKETLRRLAIFARSFLIYVFSLRKRADSIIIFVSSPVHDYKIRFLCSIHMGLQP